MVPSREDLSFARRLANRVSFGAAARCVRIWGEGGRVVAGFLLPAFGEVGMV